MANILVTSYYSRWDLVGHKGRIALFDSGNQLIENHLFTDPAEFHVIAGMLRHEKPLWFDTDVKHLRTGSEPVGEWET
ncbi:MAG: hypothetical protein HGB22_05785 [Chlorobiaceae bacterium]|nr:hypothetical protein [Chlorobiaceae bacterium]